MKKVYVALSADLIHHGHLNIINEAKKYGEVIVSVLADKSIASYKRLPFMNFEQRKIIVENNYYYTINEEEIQDLIFDKKDVSIPQQPYIGTVYYQPFLTEEYPYAGIQGD